MIRFCLANITWNKNRWQGVDVNPKAGHLYVQENIANESFNFDFSKRDFDTKRDLDTPTHVYGHVQTTYRPVQFESPGFILFVSKNLDNDQIMVVGIYGNAEFLKDKITHKLDVEHEITFSIRAEKRFSILFPKYLNAGRYKKRPIVPRVGFTYITQDVATKIVADEIEELVYTHNNNNSADLAKLYCIFEQVSGKAYPKWLDLEQEKLDELVSREPKTTLMEVIRDLEAKKSRLVECKGVYVSRNAALIIHIKALRGYKCQICGTAIERRNGSPYVEAAHIKPKREGGSENLDNIMILCPNHHKEFDVGNRVVIKHTDRHVEFVMNGKKYLVRLDDGNADRG